MLPPCADPRLFFRQNAAGLYASSLLCPGQLAPDQNKRLDDYAFRLAEHAHAQAPDAEAVNAPTSSSGPRELYAP